ncbi:MAG TPA: hypothetical protein VFH27_15320 [Longimicrobiaceae bacterium]|nr:hypothetical protein [Longimicrobiaceae bacterium]
MPIHSAIRLTALGAALVLAMGCKPTGVGNASADAADDTAGAAATGGMTEAQLREQAKPVSPDEARQMGIPDSSTLPGSANEVSDSDAAPAATPGDGPGAATDSAARPAAPAPARPPAKP